MKVLHVMSLNDENDQVIGSDIRDYFLTPDNRKIVFYEQESFIEEAEEANIFIVNSDGSNRYQIAGFRRRHTPIYGPLMTISPTGEKVAFVNSEGIATVDIDGSNLIQIVNLPDPSLEILDWH